MEEKYVTEAERQPESERTEGTWTGAKRQPESEGLEETKSEAGERPGEEGPETTEGPCCEACCRTKHRDSGEYQNLMNRLKRIEGQVRGIQGMVIDIVKKHLAQGHELDREGLIAELGDVAWYLAETAMALDVTLDEVLERNIEKLRKRYPEGFSTEQSLHRSKEEAGGKFEEE